MCYLCEAIEKLYGVPVEEVLGPNSQNILKGSGKPKETRQERRKRAKKWAKARNRNAAEGSSGK